MFAPFCIIYIHVFLFVRQTWEPAHHIDHTKPFKDFLVCVSQHSLIAAETLIVVSPSSMVSSYWGYFTGILSDWSFVFTDISLLCGLAQLMMFSKIWMNNIWCIPAPLCWFTVTSVKEAHWSHCTKKEKEDLIYHFWKFSLQIYYCVVSFKYKNWYLFSHNFLFMIINVNIH